jgi:hypothetical protein
LEVTAVAVSWAWIVRSRGSSLLRFWSVRLLIMPTNYKRLTLVFFIFAVILRVLLFLINPPQNAFDNHFEPILLTMNNGSIPAKDACWQCYQPPLFYWISAKIGNLFISMGGQRGQLLKLLQFICCIYGILTVWMVYLVLSKLQLSNFSKLFAFGTVCFLPRHIYMSAINSNDAISYLFVAICIYLLIVTIEDNYSIISLAFLSVAITLTLYTKYTSFVVLPVMIAVFLLALFYFPADKRRKYFIYFFLATLIPVASLGVTTFNNLRAHKTPLPWNLQLKDPSKSQPRDGRLSYFSFKPWEKIESPIIRPGKLSSFWTLLYSGFWFDTEPKFLYFLDSNKVWWNQYYAWLRGERNFPGDNPSMSIITKAEGAGLLSLGLFPLIIIIIGGYRCLAGLRNSIAMADLKELTKMSIFPTLLICNILGIFIITLRLPVFSAMKASYLLNSIPAFAVFLGFGLMGIENWTFFKWLSIIIFVTIYLFVTFHIIHIVTSYLGYSY